MDTGQLYLNQLNNDIATNQADIKEAWESYRDADEPLVKATCLKRWEILVKERETLLAERKDTFASIMSSGSDPSTSIAVSLVSEGPSKLPALEELGQLLQRPLPSKVPLAAAALHLLKRRKNDFILDTAGSSLSIAISAAVHKRARVGGEPLTAFYVGNVLVGTLEALDTALPEGKRLGLDLQRDRADKSSQMTSQSESGHSLRPDLMLREADTEKLLFKGEEKGAEHGLMDAVTDLTKKTARWTEYYYGNLDYLLSYGAAGNFFQFFALRSGSTVTAVEISPVYDLADADDRAAVVLASINLYTVLTAVRHSLPRYLLPAGQTLLFTDKKRFFKRTLFFCPDQPRVIKKITPWSAFKKAYRLEEKWLKEMYKLTAKQVGLVHAKVGPLFKGDAYHVELEPIGLRNGAAAVTSELELRHAAHGLLQGLNALHSAGYVHRDMRWPNTACNISKERYFILDLELAAPANLDRHPEPMEWTSDTLVGGLYTRASDVYMLGRMLRDHAKVASTAAAKDFLIFVEKPAEQLAEENVTAASLLRHAWFN